MARVEYFTRATAILAVLTKPPGQRAEFLLTKDHWQYLPDSPVLGWMLDGDPTLEKTTAPKGVKPPTFADAEPMTAEERLTDDLMLKEIEYTGWQDYFDQTDALIARGLSANLFQPPSYMVERFGPQPTHTVDEGMSAAEVRHARRLAK
jgi:hypothetical protein